MVPCPAVGAWHHNNKEAAELMRLLFCNYEYPPLGGGGGVVNAALARELARAHEVTVLTSRAFDLPAESVEDESARAGVAASPGCGASGCGRPQGPFK